MRRKKICIVTGSRAEWGLFYPLAKELSRNKSYFRLQIVATGAHLSSEFGFTYKEIEKDGFKIDRKVIMLLPGETEEIIVKSVSVGIAKVTRALQSLKPDLIFVLGDRFETFAVATASLFLKIPIAHIHGGEITEGSIDDCLRHAITKMAYLHFVSTKNYRHRVIQMGESPGRVFNVGALGLDNIKNTKWLEKREIERKLNFKFGKRNILVTFNPLTLYKKEDSEKQYKALLKSISQLPNTKIILTRSNVDMYAKSLIKITDRFVLKNRKNAKAYTSLGREMYLNMLRLVDVVAGNSSSGIIEAPSFHIPTINIGDRQRGRIKSRSVIDAKGTCSSMKDAFKKAFSAKFRRQCKLNKNLYGKGNTAKRITNIIKKVDFSFPKKTFYDLNNNSKVYNV